MIFSCSPRAYASWAPPVTGAIWEEEVCTASQGLRKKVVQANGAPNSVPDHQNPYPRSGVGTSFPAGCCHLSAHGDGSWGTSSHCVAKLPPPLSPCVAQEGTAWETSGDICPFGVGAGTRPSPHPVKCICVKICGAWAPDLALQGAHSLPPDSCPFYPHSFHSTPHPGSALGHAARLDMAQMTWK